MFACIGCSDIVVPLFFAKASAHFLVLVLAVTLIRGAEIFRYTDEVGGEHYMNGEPGVAVDGGWTFVSPEGEQIALTYEADELGFRPQGAHLPQAPREAEEVLQAKALFYTVSDIRSCKSYLTHVMSSSCRPMTRLLLIWSACRKYPFRQKQ